MIEPKAFLVLKSKFLHKLFGVAPTAGAQTQIRTPPWDPMVSKSRISEVGRPLGSNSLYHETPGPKAVFHVSSAENQVKERPLWEEGLGRGF